MKMDATPQSKPKDVVSRYAGPAKQFSDVDDSDARSETALEILNEAANRASEVHSALADLRNAIVGIEPDNSVGLDGPSSGPIKDAARHSRMKSSDSLQLVNEIRQYLLPN